MFLPLSNSQHKIPLDIVSFEKAKTTVNDTKNNHLKEQISVFNNLEHHRCLSNHYSKKSPDKLKQDNLHHIKPSIGNTVVDEYTNRSLSRKIHILVLAKRILKLGKKLGIIGDSDCPMQPQVRLHSTISSLILDKQNYETYTLNNQSLKQNSSKIKEVLSSEKLRNLNLVFETWKILPDGNLGLQFSCDPEQNIQIKHNDLKEMIEKKGKHLTLEQKNYIYNSLTNYPNVYDPNKNIFTLTRLQSIRLDLALAGAEIKSFIPGTFMVIAWTKDATALKNHVNAIKFFEKINNLASKNLGLDYIPDNIKEFAYNERTLHPNMTVDFKKKGNNTDNLSKTNLVTGG